MQKHVITQTILFMTWLIVPFFATADVFNVKEYGATGSKDTSSQTAIQRAINACHAAGGGTVYLPAGDYVSGIIALKDHVTLYLEAGATLWASQNPEDYDGGTRGRLLTAKNVKHISVIGQGTIHGQGEADYGARWGVPDQPDFRTGVLLFEDCEDITIRDVTILYSDSWTLHLKRCERVVIDGVTIHNNIHRLNSDGIDPNSCRDVRISNCHIIAGDDCIVFKSTEAISCEDIVVTNCTLETTTTAIKLGTESKGDFRNIHISNCVIKNTRTGIGFFMKDGTVMERVSFSNISIENAPSKRDDTDDRFDVFPVFMDIEKRHEDSPVGKIRDVVFRDIFIQSGSGILLQGMPESPLENITLDNITLRIDWLDDYQNRKKAVGGRRTFRDDRDTRFAQQPSYITVAYTNNLHLNNIKVFANPGVYQQNKRVAFYGYQLRQFSINNLFADYLSSHLNELAIIEDCQDGGVSLSHIQTAKDHLIQVTGTKRIQIE